MKKIILSLAVITIGLFTSCDKTKNVTPQNINDSKSLETINTNSQQARKVIYAAGWDEWGRATKSCNGWGLCNYRDCWACDPAEVARVAKVEFDDETMKGFLIIELNPSQPIERNAIDSTLTFHIDYDIDNVNSLLYAGSYTYNRNVGVYGGYKIPITIKRL